MDRRFGCLTYCASQIAFIERFEFQYGFKQGCQLQLAQLEKQKTL